MQTLVQMLQREPYSGTRARAALALGEAGDRTSVKPLIAALRDKSSVVRRDAAKSLALLGDPSAIPALRRAAREAAPDAVNTPRGHQESQGAIGNAIAALQRRAARSGFGTVEAR